MREGERHRVDAAEVERAVGPYQTKRRLGEALGLFHTSGCHSAPRRDEQSPAVRGGEVEAVADAQPGQFPGFPGLHGALLRVRRYGHHCNATLIELVELRFQFSELAFANGAVKAAIEQEEGEMLGPLASESNQTTADKVDVERVKGMRRHKG